MLKTGLMSHFAELKVAWPALPECSRCGFRRVCPLSGGLTRYTGGLEEDE